MKVNVMKLNVLEEKKGRFVFFKNNIHHTFVEPYPEKRLNQILRKSDITANKTIKNKVQFVKLEQFQMLDKNDILFIDSSHVTKIGSDVNYLIFEVIPALEVTVFEACASGSCCATPEYDITAMPAPDTGEVKLTVMLFRPFMMLTS